MRSCALSENAENDRTPTGVPSMTMRFKSSSVAGQLPLKRQPMHERISPGRRTMTSSFSMTSIMDGLCTAVPLRSRYPLLPVTSTAESSKTAPSILNK